MPRKPRKEPAPPRRKRRFGRWIALILAAALLAFTGWMLFQARLVHVRRAEIVLEDLPASFDGTTLLYASDLDLSGAASLRRTIDLFDRLQALEPDVLLLGGDFTAASLLDRLNGSDAAKIELRSEFLASIADFAAPMGKFAISGDNDGSPEALELALKQHGVAFLDGRVQILSNGTDAIAIAGLGASTSGVSAMAAQIPADRCAVVLAHSPDQIVSIRIAEASGGGNWADLVLTGHTHGGLIRLFDRSLLSLTEVEKRYPSGWHTDAADPLLVSSGVGSEGVGLRLNTRAEVWLITLRGAD